MATAQDEQYDLLLLVDATASMKSYLRSLRTSLPQIISTSVSVSRSYGKQEDIATWSGRLHLNQRVLPVMSWYASIIRQSTTVGCNIFFKA